MDNYILHKAVCKDVFQKFETGKMEPRIEIVSFLVWILCVLCPYYLFMVIDNLPLTNMDIILL